MSSASSPSLSSSSSSSSSLRHWSYLHRDGFQGVVEPFPLVPDDPVAIATVGTPHVDPVEVGVVTVVVPEGPEVQQSAVLRGGQILVSIEGGELPPVVMNEGIPWWMEHRTAHLVSSFAYFLRD